MNRIQNNEDKMRLTYSGCINNTFVIARDIENKRILLGGLGVFGVGRMWFDEAEHDKDYPGYNKAEIITNYEPSVQA